MLSYQTVQTATDEEFNALTSLTKTEFEELLKPFSDVWEEFHFPPGTPHRGRPAKLASSGDQLWFMLFYLKNYPLQEVLGFLFGLDQSQANRWRQTLSGVLRETLRRGGYWPAREAQSLENNVANLSSPDLILDGTERRRQRPTAPEDQKRFYRGKKTAHTLKNLVLVNEESQRVEYLSPTVEGKRHDNKLADDSQLTLPATATVIKDKGFEGYEVPGGAGHYQPQTKPKGEQFSPLQQTLNSVISGVRIVVEHVLAGLKPCRMVKDVFRNTTERFDDLVMEMVKDVFRNTTERFDDLVMEMACGLHNLRVVLAI